MPEDRPLKKMWSEIDEKLGRIFPFVTFWTSGSRLRKTKRWFFFRSIIISWSSRLFWRNLKSMRSLSHHILISIFVSTAIKILMTKQVWSWFSSMKIFALLAYLLLSLELISLMFYEQLFHTEMPKSQKDTGSLTVFFALLGTAWV